MLRNIYNFISRCILSTLYKFILFLYFLFGSFSVVIATTLSIIISFIFFLVNIVNIEKIIKHYFSFVSVVLAILWMVSLLIVFGVKFFIFGLVAFIFFFTIFLILKFLNIKNKWLSFFLKINFIYMIKRILIVKLFFLCGYIISDYSYCNSIITETMHSLLSSATSPKSTENIVKAATACVIIGGISYCGLKGYEYFKNNSLPPTDLPPKPPTDLASTGKSSKLFKKVEGLEKKIDSVNTDVGLTTANISVISDNLNTLNNNLGKFTTDSIESTTKVNKNLTEIDLNLAEVSLGVQSAMGANTSINKQLSALNYSHRMIDNKLLDVKTKLGDVNNRLNKISEDVGEHNAEFSRATHSLLENSVTTVDHNREASRVLHAFSKKLDYNTDSILASSKKFETDCNNVTTELSTKIDSMSKNSAQGIDSLLENQEKLSKDFGLLLENQTKILNTTILSDSDKIMLNNINQKLLSFLPKKTDSVNTADLIKDVESKYNLELVKPSLVRSKSCPNLIIKEKSEVFEVTDYFCRRVFKLSQDQLIEGVSFVISEVTQGSMSYISALSVLKFFGISVGDRVSLDSFFLTIKHFLFDITLNSKSVEEEFIEEEKEKGNEYIKEEVIFFESESESKDKT